LLHHASAGGPLGDIDGCECALGFVLGALVCASNKPGDTGDSAAARMKYFMTFLLPIWGRGAIPSRIRSSKSKPGVS
jgi:hypothetical protein